MRIPRRVVTGHTPEGASVVLSDGPVPSSQAVPDEGVWFHEVWNTSGAPALLTAAELVEPTHGELSVPPPRGGTRIRINDFAPGHLDERDLQSPVHRTASIDYGIVLEGEVTLVLDDSEVVLRAGDVVVQRGTEHAWANRSDRSARVVFILVDATFDNALAEALPGGLDRLMRGGPQLIEPDRK